MTSSNTGRRFFCQLAIWTVAVIVGLTVTLIAVGLLGLWVLIGAIAGLVATPVTGWLLGLLFCTDIDDVIAKRRQTATDRDILP